MSVQRDKKYKRHNYLFSAQKYNESVINVEEAQF